MDGDRMRIEFDTEEIFDAEGDPFKATESFDDLLALIGNPLVQYTLKQFLKGVAITVLIAGVKYGVKYMQEGGFDKLKDHFQTVN